MKKILKLVTLTAAAMILALLPNANSLRAQAATNYYVRYNTTLGEWRMQIGEWNEELEGREIYYLNYDNERFQDGDTLVILECPGGSVEKPLTVDAKVGSLIVSNPGAVVHTKGINECYILKDCYAAINGDVFNAYVYDNSTCTFNDNVTNLRLISTAADRPYVSVTVGGTLAYESETNPEKLLNEYYNFPAGKFVFDRDKGVTTDPAYFTKTGDAPATQPEQPADPAPSETPAAPAAPAAPGNGDYDDVPKTGDSNLVFLLLGISAVCFAGRYALKKAH